MIIQEWKKTKNVGSSKPLHNNNNDEEEINNFPEEDDNLCNDNAKDVVDNLDDLDLNKFDDVCE